VLAQHAGEGVVRSGGLSLWRILVFVFALAAHGVILSGQILRLVVVEGRMWEESFDLPNDAVLLLLILSIVVAQEQEPRLYVLLELVEGIL
jgi:hypothetical protein